MILFSKCCGTMKYQIYEGGILSRKSGGGLFFEAKSNDEGIAGTL